MKPLVSIIIVNWNGESNLSDSLSSLTRIDYPNFEIILVDNGSADGSVKYVKSNFPQIKIIQNRKNLGFAQANNIGFKRTKGKYTLFLNNDKIYLQSLAQKIISFCFLFFVFLRTRFVCAWSACFFFFAESDIKTSQKIVYSILKRILFSLGSYSRYTFK